MNYCSHCGSNDIQFIIPEHDDYHRHVCANCGSIHYQNPRLIVGCLATFENKILLCKRNIEPQFGFWNLPAGFLENGEKAEEGAVRETYEESRAIVAITKLHVLFNLPTVNQVYLHFLAKMDKPEFATTHESSEVDLFLPEEIPWDDIAFESTTFALKKFIEYGTDYPGVHIGSFVKKESWH